MSSTADDEALLALVSAATQPRTESTGSLPARFALELHPRQDPVVVAAGVVGVLAGLGARVSPLSALDPEVLVLDLLDRALVAARPAACFTAGYALADRFDLVGAEPDLPTAFFPEQGPLPGDASPGGALSGFPPGCYVDPEPALEATPDWAIDAMHVPAAWVYSDRSGVPSRGEDVVVAQPDTGITPHVELAGVAFVPGFDVIDDDNDPTDPLTEPGNPGHGTGTASVLVSLESYVVTGSAPRARLMPIRTIESVVRIRQVTVARAVDWAIQEGAQVITMSLGGIPATALQRAIARAVAADIIVLAAAGNCVRVVVWPARYDDCIAVAATNAADQPWPGSCRGASVDISAPGQNVYRAVVPPGGPTAADTVAQGQGTSFAVALTAGVAALWLAHHGRATVLAAAQARAETVQVMFRRLLQATARRPTPWDAQSMGPGIVDARALLEASLDLDWHRFGPEVATTLLARQLPGPPPAGAAVSEPLARNVSNPRLRAGLGLGPS